MKNKKNIIIISAIFILIISFAIVFSNTKNNINNFVLNNQDELLSISNTCLNGGVIEEKFKKAKLDGVFYGENDIVQFTYSSTGLAPSSKYYGFYYSENNTPVAFQNADIALTEISDDNWEWTDGTDNGGITTKIEENWFYYEAWF
ncbi:MAG: hypothetical protein R3Y35_13410 [Clostridia bacterium]